MLISDWSSDVCSSDLPDFALLMLLAMGIGLVFGLIPGLSGITALAILMPFIYGMEPLAGLGLLLAAHSVINTGGAVPAIMDGIRSEDGRSGEEVVSTGGPRGLPWY